MSQSNEPTSRAKGIAFLLQEARYEITKKKKRADKKSAHFNIDNANLSRRLIDQAVRDACK